MEKAIWDFSWMAFFCYLPFLLNGRVFFGITPPLEFEAGGLVGLPLPIFILAIVLVSLLVVLISLVGKSLGQVPGSPTARIDVLGGTFG